MKTFKDIQPVLLVCLSLLISAEAISQNVGIGTDTPHPSAILDLSTDSAGILVPRMTGVQRDAIDSVTAGLLVFVTDDSSFYYCTGAGWEKLGEGNIYLSDSDDDTKIMVEQTPDDDVIRFINAGTEYFRMENGRLAVENTGHSVFIGNAAGISDDLVDNYNVFVGDSAGMNTTQGQANAAFGSAALLSNTIGTGNAAFGFDALRSSTTGQGNTAFGYSAMRSNTTGNYNSAIGTYALIGNTSGTFNVAHGPAALYYNSIGSYNTSLGSAALYSNSTGGSNVALGYLSMAQNISGYGNVAIGTEAGYNALADSSIFIGYRAGYDEVGGHRLYIENSEAGPMGALIYGEFNNNLLRVNGKLHVNGTLDVNGAYDMPLSDGLDGQLLSTDGFGNASWIDQAPAVLVEDADSDTKIQVEESADEDKIRFDLGGTEHFVMDNGRLEVKNTGGSVIIGENAGSMDDFSDNNNVFIGLEAGMLNTVAQTNVAVGVRALKSNTTGYNNTVLGGGAMIDNQTGWNNTAIGTGAMESNTSGIRNTSVGGQSLRNNTTGQRNVAIGFWALQANETGGNNVAIGDQAGYLNEGSGSVFIGNSAGYGELQGNRLYIENAVAGPANALIYGEFDNDYLRVNANLSIRNGFSDIDNDTKIQVEESADEDIIRFDIAGSEKFRMLNGRLELANNGNSVFIGEGAGASDDLVDNNNVFVGYLSGNANTSGDGNVAVGQSALLTNTTGVKNTAIGRLALTQNTVGNNNVALGQEAGHNSTGSGNVFIGYKAGYNETQSNQLYISNSDANRDNALIYGDFGKKTLNINGNTFIQNLSLSSTAFAVLDNSGSDLIVVPEDGDILMPSLSTGAGVLLNILASGELVRNTSTRRDKRNIADFTADFDRILEVQPRTYNRPQSPGKLEIGYIAEEMDSIGLHELVIRSESGQVEGLYYDKIVLYTNEVLKKHDAEIAELKEIVADQQAIIEKQSAILEQLLSRESGLGSESAQATGGKVSATDN